MLICFTTRIRSVERGICPIASLNVTIKYTALMSVFLNVIDIVIIIDGCRKCQPSQMNLVEFHVDVHMQ